MSYRRTTHDSRPTTHDSSRHSRPARRANGKPDQHEDSDRKQGSHRMSPRVARARMTPALGITDATVFQISAPRSVESAESSGRVDRARDQPYASILKAWCARPGRSLGRNCEEAPSARFTNHLSGERVSVEPRSWRHFLQLLSTLCDHPQGPSARSCQPCHTIVRRWPHQDRINEDVRHESRRPCAVD